MGDRRTRYRAFTEIGLLQTVEEEGAEAAASGHGNDIARLEVEGECFVGERKHDVIFSVLCTSVCAGLQRINAEQQHTISKLSSENARLVKQVCLHGALSGKKCDTPTVVPRWTCFGKARP